MYNSFVMDKSYSTLFMNYFSESRVSSFYNTMRFVFIARNRKLDKEFLNIKSRHKITELPKDTSPTGHSPTRTQVSY